MLKGHDLFQALSVDETSQLNGFSSTKHFSAGEMIFEYNEPAGHVYMLMSGSVNLRLPATEQDFSLVVSRIEEGELFGLSPLLDSVRYTATAQCVNAVEVLSIEARPFREMLKNNSLVGFNIMNRVADIYFNRYIDVLKNLQGVVGQISLIR